MKRIIIIIGLFLLFKSCSIIDDSDITDPNADFRLAGISLSQNSQDGIKSLGSATVINDNQGRIDSIIWSGWSNTQDFRFRTGDHDPLVGLQGSGITTNGAISGAVTTSFFYNSEGSISRISNRVDGKLFEAYLFTYNQQSHLETMVTVYGDDENPCLIDQVDCNGAALLLIDSIAYSGNKIDHIRRLVNNGTFKSTSAFYTAYGNVLNSCGQSGNFPDDELGALAVREFTFISDIPPPETSTFDNCQQTSSSKIYMHQNFGGWDGGSTDSNKYRGTLIYYPNVKGQVLATIWLQDQRISYEGNFNQNSGYGVGNPQNRLPDFYYFHPFLFFPNHFKHGVELSQIYFVDWWIISQEIDQAFTFTKNREINIDFLITTQ